jgi:thiosulfate dehydrogenase (quinone) large subunit
MKTFKSKASPQLQSAALVLLRTLIGWHFLYEGYYKLVLPAWSRDGHPLARWSSAGFLRAASVSLLQRLADARWTPWIDRAVEVALVAIGLSLMLGLLTRIGCWGALIFLTLVYVASIPLQGTPQSGAEGVYLLVNKNLIELTAVLVLMTFRTGEIAGIDLLLQRRREPEARTA